MTHHMRLFVAVDIDEATRAQVAIAQTTIQRVVADARVPPRVTWVKAHAVHMTLRFIGEASEVTAKAIQDALAAAVIDSPFDVTWQTVGTFGGTRSPRVIWVAPTAGAEDLRRLAARVNARLDPLLGAGAARPFAPHLTLGRIRDAGRGVDWPRAVATVRFAPTITRIDHVTLYQSRLSPAGPTYTALSTHG